MRLCGSINLEYYIKILIKFLSTNKNKKSLFMLKKYLEICVNYYFFYFFVLIFILKIFLFFLSS